MQCLRRRQTAEGALPAAWGRGIPPAIRGSPSLGGLAVVHYLEAAVREVEAAFAADSPAVPAEIDPADGRVAALLRWLGQLPANARVADVGCGKGRYWRYLLAARPAARLVGIDPSPAMLAGLPPGVDAHRGSLLATGEPDAAYDGAFAIESLEHALFPQQAVAELCRIVRPGGRVLVIDKHRSKQPLSHHEPWERWFTPQELRAWLARDCDEVCVVPVPHLEGRPGCNLFLAATARRRP
jgi:malonyl-CoA O-methyltransferase